MIYSLWITVEGRNIQHSEAVFLSFLCFCIPFFFSLSPFIPSFVYFCLFFPSFFRLSVKFCDEFGSLRNKRILQYKCHFLFLFLINNRWGMNNRWGKKYPTFVYISGKIGIECTLKKEFRYILDEYPVREGIYNIASRLAKRVSMILLHIRSVRIRLIPAIYDSKFSRTCIQHFPSKKCLSIIQAS